MWIFRQINGMTAVWPDGGIKSSPISIKVAKNVTTTFFLKSWFSKSPNSFLNIWAIFMLKYVIMNFIKSPNLVSLGLIHKIKTNSWKPVESSPCPGLEVLFCRSPKGISGCLQCCRTEIEHVSIEDSKQSYKGSP